MPNTTTLRADATDMLREMQDILDYPEGEHGALTPEQRRRYDALEIEYDELADKIHRLEGGGRKTPRNSNTPLHTDAMTVTTTMTTDQIPTTPRPVRGAKKYADLFGKQKLSTAGFKSPDEFWETIHSGLHDSRLAALTSGEYSDPLGGFAVPTEYAAAMLDTALESEIVRPRARVEPMQTDEKRIPRWDGYDHSSGLLFGGLDARWVAETDSQAETNAKIEQLGLTAHKLRVYTKISNELIADGRGFHDTIGNAMASAIGWSLDDAFLNGTGAGVPSGILSDPAVITVAKESAQAASTVEYPNITKMFARMYPAGRTRAVWVASSTVIPQLLEMTVDVGTGGAFIPAMTNGPDGFSILTRPVVFTEKLPTLGTEGDLIFVDFSQYVIGLREEIRVDRSAHVGFANDETAFRALIRVDGRGSWRTAMTPKNGDTLSWIVTLATRA